MNSRLFVCGSSLAALLVAMSAGVAFGDTPFNLVNPGFETVENGRAMGWNYGANFKATRDGHNGSGGLVWTFTKGLDDVDGLERCAWQEVGPLKAGRCYVLSVNVQPRGVTTVQPKNRMGITIRLEGFDASGKRIVQTRSLPMLSGTHDWMKVEDVTRPMPAGVVSAKLEILASNCTGGSAAIDQVYLAEQEKLPVEAVYSSAYRNEETDGQVKFAAVLNYELGTQVAEHSADFVYRGRSGEERRVKAAELTEYGAWAMLDVGDFALGTNTVSCELQRDGKTLGRSGMEFVRLSAPAKRRVTLDRYGRTVIDGKPTFLMGMILEKPVTDEWLKIYAEAEFNVLCCAFANREELDLVRKYGLYAIVRAQKGYDDDDHGLARTREIVERVKDHPATAIIYINDEQPVANERWIRARKELVWQLDPDHPTWCAQDVPSDAREHMSGFDVLGCDPYPVGYGSRDGSVQDTFGVMRKLREQYRRSFALKPAIHIPQYFSWAWLRRATMRQNRSPSPQEMANMSWQMIALGANGLVGYSFGQLFKHNRDKMRPYERAEFYWPVIKAFVHDIRRYENVILSVEPAPTILGGESDTVAARVWRKDGDVYLLAVSGENRISSVKIRLSEPVGKIVDWDFCEKPTAKGDTVTFEFPPCGFGMVRLKRQ